MSKDFASVSPHALRAAPGPPRGELQGENPLEFLLALTCQYGDVVQYRMPYGPTYLLNHPEYIKHVLHSPNYERVYPLKMALGAGLLTSDGAPWLRQRRLMQPAFHPQRLAPLGSLITDDTLDMLRRWRTVADQGRPLNVTPEMMGLTLSIIAKALFSVDISEKIDILNQVFARIHEDIGQLVCMSITGSLRIDPARNRRFQAALRTLDEIVYEIIAARRRHPGSDDLLSRLLQARDEETGQGMDDRQLRDEVVTLMVAGHETTATMLAWTWYLLAAHPDVERRVQAELAEVLGGRVPVVEDLPALEYTQKVLQESMRLYPPVWSIGRKASVEDEVGGFLIPADAQVIVSPYTMHRHPAYWPEPEKFDPERFAPETSATRPRTAYLPFGSGQHFCIGSDLALMEGTLVLATIAQQYRLCLVPGHPVEPEPLVTLRQRHGLLVTLEPRSATLVKG